MFTKARKPQFLAGIACMLIAVATLPFSAPAHAAWSSPTATSTWDRMNYSCEVAGPGCNPNSVGINGIALSPDNSILLSTEQSLGRVQFINTSNGSVIATVTVGAAPGPVVINAAGTSAYVSNVNDSTISVIDMSSRTVTQTISGLCSGVQFLAISPTSNYLIQTCSGNWTATGTVVNIIDLSTFTVTQTINATNPSVRVTFDPSGNSFWAVSKWGTADTAIGNYVSKYELSSGNLLSTVDTGDIGTDGITNIDSNTDGSILYVLKDSGAFQAWTDLTTTPRKLWTANLRTTHTRDSFGIDPFDVDNVNHLAYFVTDNCCGYWPQIIEIVDLFDGTMLPALSIDETGAKSIEVSSDGANFYVSGSRYSTLWKYSMNINANPHVTTTTTAATTTTTLATTTTTGGGSGPTTTVDNHGTINHETEDTLALTGKDSSSNLFAVFTLLTIGAGLILTARRRINA